MKKAIVSTNPLGAAIAYLHQYGGGSGLINIKSYDAVTKALNGYNVDYNLFITLREVVSEYCDMGEE